MSAAVDTTAASAARSCSRSLRWETLLLVVLIALIVVGNQLSPSSS